MAKKSRKPVKRKTRGKKKRQQRGWFRRILPALVLIFCAGLAALALYMVYLDQEVRTRFEGTRWKLPAKVYASPLELYAGLDLSEKGLKERLHRLGYSPASSIARQGTYKISGNHVALHIRQFQYWDGTQPDQKIQLTFGKTGVASLKSLDSQKSVALVRMDPLFIGSIYPVKGADRILVKIDDVPKLLPAGLIQVEDRSFMHNWGISLKSIARAAWADLLAGHIVQGGSTITQQLVKNFYLNSEQTLERKAKEALMAILLDAHYSKKSILEAYMNEVFLGQHGNRAIRGFGLASYFYFQKPVQDLNTKQIALLVGMVKGPSYYNPRRHPKRAKARRNVVLDVFHERGLIDDKTWKKTKASDLSVTSDATLSQTRYPDFVDLVRKQLLDEYDHQDLTEGGLRVFTTLDPSIQTVAQQQLSEGLKRVEGTRGIGKDTLEGAVVVTSIESNQVLALVGGRKAGFAGFNRAVDARRQIGSLMKPIDYLTALGDPTRFNPITPLDDSPLAVKLANGKVWKPRNYARRSNGKAVPLYYALEHSLNIASTRLSLDTGINNIVGTLHKLGLKDDVTAVPALALGAINITPLDVAQMYNTIATGGYYTPLRAIRDVTTRHGEPLNRYSLQVHHVIDAGPAYITQWLMQRVARHGTGSGMYRIIDPSKTMAGKTGTTNGLRDAWFAGFGGNRLSVVWVGRDDNKTTHLTGAVGALPIWAHIMKDIDARGIIDTPPESVTQIPLQLLFSPIDANNGLGPNPNAPFERQDCPEAVKVPFMKGFVPEGVKPCATDIMSANVKHEHREKEDKGGWFQNLF